MLRALLLGLYDEEEPLYNVGAAGAFSRENRIALCHAPAALEIASRRRSPVEIGASEGQRCLVMQSRWTGQKDLGFHPLRPILVAEVKPTTCSSDRFRHVASFVRWRPDWRSERAAARTNNERPVRFDVASVLSGRGGLMAETGTHIEDGRRAVRVPIPTRSTSPSPAARSSMWFPTAAVSEFMLPYILNRPQRFERWPDGVLPGVKMAQRVAGSAQVRRSTRSAFPHAPIWVHSAQIAFPVRANG